MENTLYIMEFFYLQSASAVLKCRYQIRRFGVKAMQLKDKALADKDNLDYIIKMSKSYPDAVLILAHAARSFASWTC